MPGGRNRKWGHSKVQDNDPKKTAEDPTTVSNYAISPNAAAPAPAPTPASTNTPSTVPSFEPKCEAANRIYNVQSLSNLISDNLVCRKCKGRVFISEDLHGIASLTLNCNNCEELETMSPMIDSAEREKTKKGTPKMTKIIDYAINKFALLGTFFCGKAGQDTAEFLSFLDLPYQQRFERWFYENQIVVIDVLRDVGNNSISEALEAEIDATVQNKQNMTLEEWLKIPKDQRVPIRLDVSFDMGWQKRSSGKTYDSLSGHAFMIGQATKKVIVQVVYSKACAICSDVEQLNKDPREHDCPKNWEGTPKAMESNTELQMCHNLFDQNKGLVYLGSITSDDDSSMRKLLSYPVKMD